jgi:hypothetical protein
MNEINFTCTNCGALSSGLFCSSCGQKKFLRKQFELRQSIREIFSEFSDLESSLGKTIRTLILQPGRLTADYLAGKQKSYVSPVKLYLIVITANFLLYRVLENYSFLNIELLKNLAADIPWVQRTITEASRTSALSIDIFYHQVNSQINDTLPIFLYLLIFAQALVLKVQFIKHHRYYIEHLVFALHFMSFGFLRDMALLPIQFLNAQIALVISIITTIAYLFLSLKHSYKLSGKRLLFHSLLHYTIFFFLFALTITLAVCIALRSVSS